MLRAPWPTPVQLPPAARAAPFPPLVAAALASGACPPAAGSPPRASSISQLGAAGCRVQKDSLRLRLRLRLSWLALSFVKRLSRARCSLLSFPTIRCRLTAPLPLRCPSEEGTSPAASGPSVPHPRLPAPPFQESLEQQHGGACCCRGAAASRQLHPRQHQEVQQQDGD